MFTNLKAQFTTHEKRFYSFSVFYCLRTMPERATLYIGLHAKVPPKRGAFSLAHSILKVGKIVILLLKVIKSALK